MPYRDYNAIRDPISRGHYIFQDGFVRHERGRRPVSPDTAVDLIVGQFPGHMTTICEQAGNVVWHSSVQSRHHGVHAWRRHIPGDHFEGNVPTQTETIQLANGREWQVGWGITRPTNQAVTLLNELTAPFNQPELPQQPVPRSFDCPSDHNQCQRGDCTVLHCMAQHELRMRTLPKRPPRALPPERTLGEWSVGPLTRTTVYANVGPDVHLVANCRGIPGHEGQVQANAQRIALLPRMEAALRQLGMWHMGTSGTGTDPSGLHYNENALFTEIESIVAILNRPYVRED